MVKHNTGRWTEEEEELFVEALIKCGHGKWRCISDFLGKTRSRIQCKSHWQKIEKKIKEETNPARKMSLLSRYQVSMDKISKKDPPQPLSTAIPQRNTSSSPPASPPTLVASVSSSSVSVPPLVLDNTANTNNISRPCVSPSTSATNSPQRTQFSKQLPCPNESWMGDTRKQQQHGHKAIAIYNTPPSPRTRTKMMIHHFNHQKQQQQQQHYNQHHRRALPYSYVVHTPERTMIQRQQQLQYQQQQKRQSLWEQSRLRRNSSPNTNINVATPVRTTLQDEHQAALAMCQLNPHLSSVVAAASQKSNHFIPI